MKPKKLRLTKDMTVRFVLFVVLLAISVTFIVPYFWMISNSFKSTREIRFDPNHILPTAASVDGYIKVFTKAPFWDWARNSIIVTGINTIMILFTSSLLGFVFSKYKFKFKNVLFSILLATMMVTVETTMIARFLWFNELGLYNTIWALIIPTFVSAFGVYLCKQFCDDIPNELLECARLDGAGDFRIYRSVILPLLRPCLGALAIFTFLTYWNDFLNPLLFLEKTKDMTLPLALQFFATQHQNDLSATMAASSLIMVPVTLVFLLLQKYFIKGISMTGMK